MNDNKFAVLMIVGSMLVGAIVLWILVVFTADPAPKDTDIYVVCKPKGYEVVCFGHNGTLGESGSVSCLPLSQAGGKCL